MRTFKQDLDQARAKTDQLFGLLREEAWFERPIPERHRLIFYLGHVEAFDWNQICRWTLGLPSFHPSFDELFEAGIDPPEGTLPTDQPSDWPTVDEVNRYNARVRSEVDKVLDSVSPTIVHVAIEHRWMHAETNAYLLHHLDSRLKRKPAHVPCPPHEESPPEEMVEIPKGIATLGHDPHEGFGWDNEFSQNQVEVPAFSISRYKVTNAQYRRFVEEGGAVPPFWFLRKGEWFLRTMFEDIPLPLSWPVFVTHRQAVQYADWVGMRLPSEAEFHRAAFGTFDPEEQPYPWGAQVGSPKHGNFNFYSWDPVPVDANPEGDSAFGVAQMVGNGWEWTSTPFAPFEGFSPLSTYPGYSSRFFDQDHYVVKGAGPFTAARLLRRSFRNWFRQGYSHAHTSFRCVSS